MKGRHKKGSKVLLITIIIVIIATIMIAAFNHKYLKAYYYNFSNNHYHKGDKVYASEKFIKNTDTLGVSLVRISRNQHYPYNYELVFTPYDITNETLRKHNIAEIGTYLNYKLILLSDHNKSAVLSFYAIKPNWNLISNAQEHYQTPPGYDFVDNNYYILGTTSFIKHK